MNLTALAFDSSRDACYGIADSVYRSAFVSRCIHDHITLCIRSDKLPEAFLPQFRVDARGALHRHRGVQIVDHPGVVVGAPKRPLIRREILTSVAMGKK